MFNRLIPTLLVAGFVVSCAKEKPYEKVYKDGDLLAKSSIKIEKEVSRASKTQTNETITEKVPVEYLYVPMTMGTPRQVVDAAPFYQGAEKVVRLEWSEDGLEVIEVERDKRFQENPNNESPVLTLPGKYFSYQCSEDDYGDCTNKEEENTEIEWDEKDFFLPEYTDIKIKEVNFLNVTNRVEASGCATLQGTKLVDYEISDGVINVEIEKTYKLANKWSCIRRSFDFKNYEVLNSSFKVNYYFSLVELDQLATPGFKKLAYPTADHDKFGFFKKEVLTENDEFDSQRPTKEVLMNRWAPNRKNNELVYHLSPNYTKPENKALLEATHKVVKVMNKGFTAGNVPFKLKLVEQDYRKKGVSPGDLRYNNIVLIEDPLANGLLGYGPSVSNPYTGEIVQAHTNMYGGVLTSTVRRVYQAAVDLSIDRLNKKAKKLEGITVSPSALVGIPKVISENLATAPAQVAVEEVAETASASALSDLAQMMEHSHHHEAPGALGHDHSHDLQGKLKKFNHIKVKKILAHEMKQKVDMRARALNSGDYWEQKSEFEKRIHEYEGNLDHTIKEIAQVESFPIAGTQKVIYPEVFKVKGIKNADGTLRPWESLNKTQKKKIKEIILVESYVATLIHELGHNLGLRHNFTASTDSDNYYSAEEMAKLLGVKKAEPAAYSSVMDYSASNFNQLRALGKYDVAALRYAYANEIELRNGKIIPLKHTIESYENAELINIKPALEDIRKEMGDVREAMGKLNEIQDPGTREQTRLSLMAEFKSLQDKEKLVQENLPKEFKFCTDGNAGLSSLCNKFDEGSTLTEVAKFRIKRYKDMYKYRNFRDGRLDFSSYGVYSYAYYREQEFLKIRDIFEEVERFIGFFGVEIMESGCSKQLTALNPICETINDYSAALKLIGDFFVEVLKTPDHICALADAENPTVINEYKKLEEIYNSIKYDVELTHVPSTCFDPVVVDFVKEMKGEEDKETIVVGENGKFLNGFKGNNPDFKYSSDRAVLGTWPDKMAAITALFKRRSNNGNTDTNQMALIDIPFIQNKVLNILAHYATGMTLAEPIPFKTADGSEFRVPYVIGTDYEIEQVEDAFWWVKREYGMHQSGKNNYVEIAFKRISRESIHVGEENSVDAQRAANLISINKYNAFTQINEREGQRYWFDGIDHVYHSNENMPIGNFILSSILDKSKLDEINPQVLAKVFKQRTNPNAPAILSDDHKAFFIQPKNVHDLLLNVAAQGASFPVEVFISEFGEEFGPKLFKVYGEGLNVMKSIVALKEKIMVTPETEEEKPIFDISIDVMAQYVSGQLNDELVRYYKKQLTRLPLYKIQANN